MMCFFCGDIKGLGREVALVSPTEAIYLAEAVCFVEVIYLVVAV